MAVFSLIHTTEMNTCNIVLFYFAPYRRADIPVVLHVCFDLNICHIVMNIRGNVRITKFNNDTSFSVIAFVKLEF